MHSAIVVVKLPEHDQQWPLFMATVLKETAPPHSELEGAQRLAENVWLVNFQTNPATFARLVDAAVRHRYSYGILPLDAEPQWLPGGFDPKTTQGRSS
jgi:hypothetical protein